MIGNTRPGKGDHEISAWLEGKRTTEPYRGANYIIRRTTQFPLYREEKLISWKWVQDNLKEDEV